MLFRSLHSRPYERLRMTRGRSSWLNFPRMTDLTRNMGALFYWDPPPVMAITGAGRRALHDARPPTGEVCLTAPLQAQLVRAMRTISPAISSGDNMKSGQPLAMALSGMSG